MCIKENRIELSGIETHFNLLLVLGNKSSTEACIFRGKKQNKTKKFYFLLSVSVLGEQISRGQVDIV